MLTEKLQNLRETLNNQDLDGVIPILREDLEELVSFAENVGMSGDVPQLLERFDTVSQGYIERIKRQTTALGELTGRMMLVETMLQALMKTDGVDAALITGYGDIISILRNGVRKNAKTADHVG